LKNDDLEDKRPSLLFVFQLIDHMMAGIEELIGHTGNYYWREK
jgi:hypothetical protein